MFPFGAGNTVSPPSSTSELSIVSSTYIRSKKENKVCFFLFLVFLWLMRNEDNQQKSFKVTLQVHKDSSNSLPSPFNVELIYEIVMVRLIFLSNFIMENLKTFSIFCNYYITH